MNLPEPLLVGGGMPLGDPEEGRVHPLGPRLLGVRRGEGVGLLGVLHGTTVAQAMTDVNIMF
ncbi:hypothetical protein [Nonomuraea salmonea]|uniref:hypothetical protein n=1 Tax=Nonomuraea salmonea TaxID=46181 RepID=UPI0031E629B9